MSERTPRCRPGHARVFVYGSLLRGLHNDRLLEDARFIAADRTLSRFTLVDLGSFPAMIVGGTTSVTGELWEVDAATLARLDALESHPRWYQRTPIVLASRRHAETYLLPLDRVAGKPTVPAGDWREWLASRRR